MARQSATRHPYWRGEPAVFASRADRFAFGFWFHGKTGASLGQRQTRPRRIRFGPLQPAWLHAAFDGGHGKAAGRARPPGHGSEPAHGLSRDHGGSREDASSENPRRPAVPARQAGAPGRRGFSDEASS